MIVVDKSVCIDYFNGTDSPQTNKLDSLLGNEPRAIGDLILTEILQGFRSDQDYKKARNLLGALTLFEMLGAENTIRSADHYRLLIKRGITIRKTVDVIIATYCIVENHMVLFSDKDFQPFVKELGLQEVDVGT